MADQAYLEDESRDMLARKGMRIDENRTTVNRVALVEGTQYDFGEE